MSPQEKLARTVRRMGPKRSSVAAGEKYNQTGRRPIRKVEHGALAGALTSVILGTLTWDAAVFAAGLGTALAIVGTAYLTRSRKRG